MNILTRNNAAGMTFVFILLTFLLNGFAEQNKQNTPASQQRFEDISYWARVFEDPERDKWQKPDEVVKALNLKPGDVVADIGAGTGYFTRRFAIAVGPEGKAIGLEIETGMVKYMEEDAKKLGLKNYTAKLVNTDDAGLQPNSIDVIFICDTYHHIEDRVVYLRKLSKSLKPNGRIVNVDFYKKPMPVGPPTEHKLADELVFEEFKQAGYHVVRSHDILPYQYFIEYGL